LEKPTIQTPTLTTKFQPAYFGEIYTLDPGDIGKGIKPKFKCFIDKEFLLEYVRLINE